MLSMIESQVLVVKFDIRVRFIIVFDLFYQPDSLTLFVLNF